MSGAPMEPPPRLLEDIRQLIEGSRQQARGIHVAEYLTALPSKGVLQAKLHEAIAALSRARRDARSGDGA